MGEGLCGCVCFELSQRLCVPVAGIWRPNPSVSEELSMANPDVGLAEGKEEKTNFEPQGVEAQST